MSNTLAVATVTSVLGRVLGEALAGAPPGGVQSVGVTTLRPDMLATDADARGVNIFLYQVVPNAAWAGAALPARRADGRPLARPQQALDLHYLLTFSGDEAALEPQRMLGVAVSMLAARPVLGREVVRAAIGHVVGEDPTAWEQFSDLAEQVDVVRLTMLPLSVDDLSKLWSTFAQAPYRLSVTYQATVVLLDADVTPQPALPVRSRGLDVAPLRVPSVTRALADTSPADPVLPGTTVRVEGRNLRGPAATRVRFGDVEVTVPAGQVTDTRLTVDLPPGVAAGVRGVQVLHRRLVGEPPQERDGAGSNPVPLVVRPVIDGPVTVGSEGVTVPLDPPVGRRQRVALVLNEHQPPSDRPARAYTLVAPPFDPAGPDTAGEVSVPPTGVAAGTYLVRVQVDGAESVLAAGPDGRYDSPRVTIP